MTSKYDQLKNAVIMNYHLILQDEESSAAVSELIYIYLEKSPRVIQSMMAAADDLNYDQFKKDLQTLKASSENIGAQSLADLCADIAASKFSMNVAEQNESFDLIISEFARVEEELCHIASLINTKARS